MSSASESSDGSEDPESDTSVMEKSDTALLTGLYSCGPDSGFSGVRGGRGGAIEEIGLELILDGEVRVFV